MIHQRKKKEFEAGFCDCVEQHFTDGELELIDWTNNVIFMPDVDKTVNLRGGFPSCHLTTTTEKPIANPKNKPGTLIRTQTAIEKGANQFEPNQSLVHDMVQDWGATYSEGYQRIREQFRGLIHQFKDPRRWEIQQYFQLWSSGNDLVRGHGAKAEGVDRHSRNGWDQYHAVRGCWNTLLPFLQQLPFCSFIGMGSTRNWGVNGFDNVVREWAHWAPESLFLIDPSNIYDRLGEENRVKNDDWHFADNHTVQETFGKVARFTDEAWWCSQNLNNLVEHQMDRPLTGVRLRSAAGVNSPADRADAAGVNSPADRSDAADVDSSADRFDFFATEMKINDHQKAQVRKFNSIKQSRFRYKRTHTIYSTPVNQRFADPRGADVGRPLDSENVAFVEVLRKNALPEDGELPAHYDDHSKYGIEPTTTENTELSAEKVADVMRRDTEEVEATRESERAILKQKLSERSTATADHVTSTICECYTDDWPALDDDNMRQHQLEKASKCIGWDRPLRVGDYIYPVKGSAGVPRFSTDSFFHPGIGEYVYSFTGTPEGLQVDWVSSNVEHIGPIQQLIVRAFDSPKGKLFAILVLVEQKILLCASGGQDWISFIAPQDADADGGDDNQIDVLGAGSSALPYAKDEETRADLPSPQPKEDVPMPDADVNSSADCANNQEVNEGQPKTDADVHSSADSKGLDVVVDVNSSADSAGQGCPQCHRFIYNIGCLGNPNSQVRPIPTELISDLQNDFRPELLGENTQFCEECYDGSVAEIAALNQHEESRRDTGLTNTLNTNNIRNWADLSAEPEDTSAAPGTNTDEFPPLPQAEPKPREIKPPVLEPKPPATAPTSKDYRENPNAIPPIERVAKTRMTPTQADVDVNSSADSSLKGNEHHPKRVWHVVPWNDGSWDRLPEVSHQEAKDIIGTCAFTSIAGPCPGG